MTQAELEEAVAQATGESLRTVRHRGFSLFTPLRVFDPDDASQADPQVIDWDDLQAQRTRAAA
jgi:hypothetical protein